jgi:hypothetical protein
MEMDYEIHEVARVFPDLKDTDPEAYVAMVEDMRVNGYVGPPVVLHEGRIIDGRTRYEAWKEAGGNGELQVAKYKGRPESIAHYAFNANAQRRHLTHLQKAVIYLRMFCPNGEKPDFTSSLFTETSGVRHETADLALKLWNFRDENILDQCVSGSLTETEAKEIAASQEVVASERNKRDRTAVAELMNWLLDAAIATPESGRTRPEWTRAK